LLRHGDINKGIGRDIISAAFLNLSRLGSWCSPDDSVSRPGGAGGDDPSRGAARVRTCSQPLAFLDAVDTKVATAHRERFEQLRDQVRSADDGHGLPEALLHGNLLHNPDHALLTDQGPVAFNWKSAGRGPRLVDFAYLMWGAPCVDGDGIGAAVNAYRRHVELTDDELDRLEAVMYQWSRSIEAERLYASRTTARYTLPVLVVFGHVHDPQPVRAVGIELAADEITAIGAPVDALDAGLAHQALDPFTWAANVETES
jgi:hypothetical protein